MEQEAENVTNIQKIEEAIYKFPHLLKDIKSSKIIDAINNLLPYSHGIEFECFKKDNYQEEYFRNIPNILHVQTDSNEQRYRISSGLNGLICLYDICESMKLYSKVDLASSNHYHTDMTDVKEYTHESLDFEQGTSKEFQKSNNSWIIEELKTWKSVRSESQANLGSWYKYNDIGTLEVRIGEPTFEYEIIVKRLIQCANIVRKLKFNLDPSKYKLNLLYLQLEALKEEEKPIDLEEEEMQRIINQRNIKI